MFRSSEAELSAFLAAWEELILPKEEWTHAAHIAVAACYTWERTPAEALPLLRERIRAFNVATGGQNTADAGYHETLTCFWAEVVGSFVLSQKPGERLAAVNAAVARFGAARDLPKSFYTHDVVRNATARREWVPPERPAELAQFLRGLAAGDP
ncbi:MAG: hypothetical protein K2X03_25255 [Bryobacteraceae bacterium]|nr:hypothetical protein [Bryobacteraceae bacterium]